MKCLFRVQMCNMKSCELCPGSMQEYKFTETKHHASVSALHTHTHTHTRTFMVYGDIP